MAANGHEDAQLLLARHHEPVVAGVSHGGPWVCGHDDAGRDIRRSVNIVVSEDGDFTLIGFGTEFCYFVNRRIAHFHRRNWLRLTLAECSCEIFGLAFQSERHQTATCLGIDDHGRSAALDVVEAQERKTLSLFQMSKNGGY